MGWGGMHLRVAARATGAGRARGAKLCGAQPRTHLRVIRPHADDAGHHAGGVCRVLWAGAALLAGRGDRKLAVHNMDQHGWVGACGSAQHCDSSTLLRMGVHHCRGAMCHDRAAPAACASSPSGCTGDCELPIPLLRAWLGPASGLTTRSRVPPHLPPPSTAVILGTPLLRALLGPKYANLGVVAGISSFIFQLPVMLILFEVRSSSSGSRSSSSSGGGGGGCGSGMAASSARPRLDPPPPPPPRPLPLSGAHVAPGNPGGCAAPDSVRRQGPGVAAVSPH